jgi:hypothetical protein
MAARQGSNDGLNAAFLGYIRTLFFVAAASCIAAPDRVCS